MQKKLLIYKHYLNFLSIVAPRYGGKLAINLFQKVTLKQPKRLELNFYKQAKKIEIPYKKEALLAYELGNSKGELVFLIHGWDSNAGSLGKIANALVATNKYRIIAFDLPAHHQSNQKYTNLYDSKNAFKHLIEYINPKDSFHTIGHSFGASVSAFALSELHKKVKKIVFLSGNDVIEDMFKQFQYYLGFNDKIYNEVRKQTQKIIGEPLEDLIVSERLKKIDFEELLLIHDKYDKVIPFKNAVNIHKKIPNSKLLPFEKIGHYRMLWNNNVVKETVAFLEKN